MNDDEAQRERALQTWELVVLAAPEPDRLEAIRRILRVKRFEIDPLAASLPGVVRRGARVDLDPVAAALEAEGVGCELRRRTR